jgi:hypothetical protein
MKRVALVLGLSAVALSGARAASPLSAVRNLIEDKKYPAAESLLRLHLAADARANDSERLRMYLLEGLVQAYEGRPEGALESLRFARELFKSAAPGSTLKRNDKIASRYLSEIEMTEFDVSAMGAKP